MVGSSLGLVRTNLQTKTTALDVAASRGRCFRGRSVSGGSLGRVCQRSFFRWGNAPRDSLVDGDEVTFSPKEKPQILGRELEAMTQWNHNEASCLGCQIQPSFRGYFC